MKIFTSLTNFYSPITRKCNIYYSHHFRASERYNCDLAGNFKGGQGAAELMISVAKYMGFSNAVLLGCDYFGLPTNVGHFYSDHEPRVIPNHDLSEYRKRMKKVSEGIDIKVILPAGISSPEFEYHSFEGYFGLNREYKKNYEIIDEDYLKLCREGNTVDQILMD